MDAVQCRLVTMPKGTDSSSSKVCQEPWRFVFNTLFSVSITNFTRSSKELIHRFSASLLYLSFYYKVYMLDDASCPMFILRLFNFYMPILALGFWHLGQMVFRSRGNGHGTNQKSKWRGNC